MKTNHWLVPIEDLDATPSIRPAGASQKETEAAFAVEMVTAKVLVAVETVTPDAVLAVTTVAR